MLEKILDKNTLLGSIFKFGGGGVYNESFGDVVKRQNKILQKLESLKPCKSYPDNYIELMNKYSLLFGSEEFIVNEKSHQASSGEDSNSKSESEEEGSDDRFEYFKL